MIYFIFFLISLTNLDTDCYRFDEGYAEFWYKIPLSEIFSFDALFSVKDSIMKKYTYRFAIYSETGKDSVILEGIKGAIIKAERSGDYIIDHIPLYLYPGRFFYQFELSSGGARAIKKGEIEMPSDTMLFSGSDLILSKKSRQEPKFIRHGIGLNPLLIPEYLHGDTLFSYFEVYGLVPDSLFYEVKYQVADSTDSIILTKKLRRLKYDYIQADTFTMVLDFIDGRYRFLIEVFDPASDKKISRSKGFRVKIMFDEAGKKFYYDIQYLVGPKEYKKFCQLNEHQKKFYLKKFWSKNNYWQFEKRLIGADERFSISELKGRDTERGKFYIKNGPPDEIEKFSMASWARPFEVWHYYSGGYDALFCDIKDDGNPRLIKILKAGELTEILECGFRRGAQNEKWLFDIAPGTYESIHRELVEPLEELGDTGGK